MRKSLKIVAAAALLIFSSAASDAQTVTKLKIAEVVRSHLFIPLYLAVSQGFTKEQGLDVEIVTALGGDRVGALVLSGQADIGLSGPEVPIYIYNGDSPDKPVIFCSLNGTDGFFFVSRKKIDNFDWKMLRGQKILGWRPGSTPQLFFEYVLKRNGVDQETIKNIIVNIGIPARDGAWISGTGDFGIFSEPNTTKLETSGEVHVITPIGKEVGRAENTILFAKKSWMEKNRDAAQKLTNAIAKAQTAMKGMSDQQIASAVGSYFVSITPEINAAVVKRYRSVPAPIYSESPVINKEGLQKLQEVMVAGGVLPADKMVSYEAIVAPEFAEKAKQ